MGVEGDHSKQGNSKYKYPEVGIRLAYWENSRPIGVEHSGKERICDRKLRKWTRVRSCGSLSK